MAVSLHRSQDSRRLAVLGPLTDPAEQAEFLDCLQAQQDSAPLQIDFYDAETLPAPVIAALGRDHARRRQSLKITVYHALLGHRLVRLNLPVRQVTEPRPTPTTTTFKAIALAGSANSLDGILAIISALPVCPHDNEIVLFVVQHIGEDHLHRLDELLRVRTHFQVMMPHHLTPIAPRTIYVAPPGHHMRVAHGLLYLTRDPKVQFARPSIDVLFESLAQEYGSACLAVVLCGYGRDGMAGSTALHRAGATILVEDPSQCGDARILPDNVHAAGVAALMVGVATLTSLVAAACLGPKEIDGDRLPLFLEALWQQHGYDLRAYQRDSLQRRLKLLMNQFGLDGSFAFQMAVFTTPSLFERLQAEIGVGVTQFFRHPEQFAALRTEILPYLASFPVIKIWSAGCSTGEEAYSLAILLEELGLRQRSRLFATDSNHYFLDLAKSALYPRATLDESRSNYRKSGGEGTLDSFFEVEDTFLSAKDSLGTVPIFFEHSLLDHGVFNEFQLILCRNVLIYFNSDLQQRVLALFASSLHPSGYLVLGPQDGLAPLARSQGFVPMAQGSHIYRRLEGSADG